MRKLLITIASVCITSMIYAQSPVFSQYYTTAAYLNPALVGSESDITLGLNYRAQWNQLESPYKTVQFSYMHPLLEQGGRTRHMGGVGFSVLNDQAGDGLPVVPFPTPMVPPGPECFAPENQEDTDE